MPAYELICRDCKWRTLCGRDDAVARMRLIGLFRREADPDDGTIGELFLDAARRMTCPICKQKRLYARPSVAQAPSGGLHAPGPGRDDWSEDDAGDWQAAVLCDACRVPISLERLDAVPGVKRCAACQSLAESGELDAEPIEYCPNCGAILELRVSRGAGITRYRRFCTGDPSCRL